MKSFSILSRTVHTSRAATMRVTRRKTMKRTKRKRSSLPIDRLRRVRVMATQLPYAIASVPMTNTARKRRICAVATIKSGVARRPCTFVPSSGATVARTVRTAKMKMQSSVRSAKRMSFLAMERDAFRSRRSVTAIVTVAMGRMKRIVL
uniref:Uncharacterized protein n=1 Tax=Anopheles maculatus TaxID=74869 RepID=A0A182SV30_9DIPT